MKVDLFDFELPQTSIAQHPASPRDHARLLRVKGAAFEDKTVLDLADCLHPGDICVFNDTRVIPARLSGKRGEAGMEVTLHKQDAPDTWRAFARPAKKLKENDMLMFLDEASVKQHPNLQPKWSLKGSKEFIGTFGNHAKINVFGAISHELGRAFHMNSKKLNSDIFMKFVGHLAMLNPTKHLVLVIDNAPWHKSKKVLKFLENLSDKIEILWLPTYSPDFNPIEHLWRFMKEVVSNFFFPKMNGMIDAITDFFNSLYQKKEKIMTLCSPNYLLG